MTNNNDDEMEHDYAPDEKFTVPVVKKWEYLIPQAFWRIFLPKERRELAWLQYYHGLYQTRGPSVSLFSYMLHKYGFFDFTTPFREASGVWYKFHPENIFLADINFILDCWQTRQFPPSTSFSLPLDGHDDNHESDSEHKMKNRQETDGKVSASEVHGLMKDIHETWNHIYSHRPSDNSYRSIFDTEKENDERRVAKMEVWEKGGIETLSRLFLSSSSNWLWMEKWMHLDNLKLLVHVLMREDSGLSKDVRNSLLQQFRSVSWISQADVAYLKRSFV